MPTNAGQLVSEAKRLQRLLTRRRVLTKELRDLNREIAASRKNIKALARTDASSAFDQVPPMPWEQE